jgi:hypothetical protein
MEIPIYRKESYSAVVRALTSRSVCAILGVALFARAPAVSAQTAPSGAPVVTQRPLGYGIACLINGKQFGPPSFSVLDIGRKDVPALSMLERSKINEIQRYVPSRNLRFVVVHMELMVYNAVKGPCWAGAPGYQVLNGQTCKAMWSPTDGPGALPDCWNPPRPWIEGDGGKGSPSNWQRGIPY